MGPPVREYNRISRFIALLTAPRLSQIASQGPVALAEKLTQSLREQGDLELANPELESR